MFTYNINYISYYILFTLQFAWRPTLSVSLYISAR